MIYTPKLQKAIRFAIKVHQLDQNQTRMDQRTPYIVHPLSVALILSQVGADEDVIVAGVLHDVLEDSTKENKVTKKLLEKEFGNAVAEMVNDVSEQDMALPKEERKRLAIEHIAKMGHPSILLKSADQLQNMTDLIHSFEQEGERAFVNSELTKDEMHKIYKIRIQALENAWTQNPLLPEIKSHLEKIESLLNK